MSLVFGAIVAAFVSEHRATTALLVAGASFSHWILDLVVHTPDLPLYDDSAKVGFGLWRHVALSFPLELIVLGLGAFLYARAARFPSARARYAFWGFVVFLAAMQGYANFGPPPSSSNAMAVMAIGLYAVMALLAAWVERIASANGDAAGIRQAKYFAAAPGSFLSSVGQVLRFTRQNWCDRRHLNADPCGAAGNRTMESLPAPGAHTSTMRVFHDSSAAGDGRRTTDVPPTADGWMSRRARSAVQ